jgi:hypothetical protein
MNVQGEFDAAVAVARDALERFNEQPLFESKRGGARISVWFPVWRDSSKVAIKWHRRLQAEPEPSVHDTIDRILGGEE